MPASQSLRFRNAFTTSVVVLFASLLASCGGSMSGGTGGGGGGTQTGNTTVTLMLTSTANDQLTAYWMAISSISLVDSTGKIATLYSNPSASFQTAEFIHLNGVAEPFVTAQVPQGTYASAVVQVVGCSFEDLSASGTALTTAVSAEGLCSEGTGNTTVNLPAPIKVSGTAEALSLDLLVGSSWTFIPATDPNLNATYTIDPVFTLTMLNVSAQPTNLNNGFFAGVGAQVVAVNANPVTAQIMLSSGQSFTVKPAPTATYQGIAGFSSLVANEIVNMDLALQADGSLAATRVEVNDAASIYADTGWFIGPDSPLGTSTMSTTQPEGCPNFPTQYECTSLLYWDSSTVFGVSGQFSNTANLPFTPSFTESTATQGQNISGEIVGSATVQNLPYAQKVTLEPQTLNGIVQSMTNQNGFAVYTVALAPYDIFPVTQQQGAYPYAPQITNPQMVTVYADTSTQFLNSGLVENGQVLRFRGVVFNDNGELRMDCNAVLDGATE